MKIRKLNIEKREHFTKFFEPLRDEIIGLLRKKDRNAFHLISRLMIT